MIMNSIHAEDDKMSEMYWREKVNMRQAAYLVAVARVAESCKLRGYRHWIEICSNSTNY